MDSVTQFLLGAAIGDGLYRKKIGKSAKWWGGIAGLLPDIDIFFYRTPFDHFTVHRGYSHSLIVTILGGLLWGYIFYKLINYFQKQGKFKNCNNCLQDWCGLFVLGLVTHPLLDWFTTYGTQLMLPFNHNRYSLHAIGIIDPFYSLWLLGALLIGPFLRPRVDNRFAQAALVISTLYLGYCYTINQQALKIVHINLNNNEINHAQVNSYPTLFQPYLRNIVVQNDQQFLVTTISMWTQKKLNPWKVIKKISTAQLTLFKQDPTARIFYWFADDQVLPQQWQISPTQYLVRLSDMRFTDWFDNTKPIWGIEGFIDTQEVLKGPYYFQSSLYPQGQSIKDYWYVFKKIFRHVWHQAFALNQDEIA